MINRRLVQLPESTSRIETQEALFDTFWMDTQSRIRAAGITEISVNARLKDVQDWSIPTLLELDHAMTFLKQNQKEQQQQQQTELTKSTNTKKNVQLSVKECELEVIEGFCSTLWRQIYQRGEMLSTDYIQNISTTSASDTNTITNIDNDNIVTSNENASSEHEVNNNEIETLEIEKEEILLKPEHESVITNLAKYIFYEYQSLHTDISDTDYQNVMFRFGRIPMNFNDTNNTNTSNTNTSNNNTNTIPISSIENSRMNANNYDINIVRNIEIQHMVKENEDDNHVSHWRSTMHVDGKIYYW